MQRQHPHVQYVQQQQQPPPQRQYVQGPNGPMYMNAPPHMQQQQQPPPQMYARPMAPTQVPVTTTIVRAPAPPPPPVTTTTIVKKKVIDGDDFDTPIRVVQEVAAEGHKMVANALLAGFLLNSFQTTTDNYDNNDLNEKEATALALKIVAFGCFLSALSFYAMYLQYGRKRYMRSWVYCAQLVSGIGLVLLISAVAVTTRMQLGEEHETAWIGSISVMIILVSLPILFDICWCVSRLVGDLVDWFDDMF